MNFKWEDYVTNIAVLKKAQASCSKALDEQDIGLDGQGMYAVWVTPDSFDRCSRESSRPARDLEGTHCDAINIIWSKLWRKVTSTLKCRKNKRKIAISGVKPPRSLQSCLNKIVPEVKHTNDNNGRSAKPNHNLNPTCAIACFMQGLDYSVIKKST